MKRAKVIYTDTTSVEAQERAMLTVIMLDGDATIGVFTVPLALYLIFGSEMVIVNGYYWETKERK